MGCTLILSVLELHNHSQNAVSKYNHKQLPLNLQNLRAHRVTGRLRDTNLILTNFSIQILKARENCLESKAPITFSTDKEDVHIFKQGTRRLYS